MSGKRMSGKLRECKNIMMKVMQKLAVYAKTRIAFGVYVPYLLFQSS